MFFITKNKTKYDLKHWYIFARCSILTNFCENPHAWMCEECVFKLKYLWWLILWTCCRLTRHKCEHSFYSSLFECLYHFSTQVKRYFLCVQTAVFVLFFVSNYFVDHAQRKLLFVKEKSANVQNKELCVFKMLLICVNSVLNLHFKWNPMSPYKVKIYTINKYSSNYILPTWRTSMLHWLHQLAKHTFTCPLEWIDFVVISLHSKLRWINETWLLKSY